MRGFLVRIACFLGASLAFLAANYGINRARMERVPDAVPNVETLIAGDSYAVAGLDPAFFFPARNIAQHAQPYTLTYFTLRAVLPRASGVKRVIVSFSPHDVSSFNDRKFRDPEWSSVMIERGAPLMMLRDALSLDMDRRLFASTLVRSLMLYPRRDLIAPALGRFEPRASRLPDADVDKAIETHYYLTGKPLGPSDEAYRSLCAIADLARECHADLVLVGTPLHPEYRSRIPDAIQSYYEWVKTGMMEHMMEQTITVLDFAELPMTDEEFYTYDHLSDVGSRRFSSIVAERLERR